MATLTRRPSTVIAAGLLGGMLAAFLAVPLALPHAAQAAEAETATDEPFLDEGWWLRYRNPEAQVPKESLPTELPAEASIPGQTARGSTNPYPGEYARISAIPGEEGEEAIAGFGFDLMNLGEGFPAKITGGEVTFVLAPKESRPQAGDGANGMRNEENAAMRGCLATDLVIGEQAGNWEDKPPFDCEISSPLEPVEGSEPPTWTMDLEPFVATWAEPTDNHGFIVTRDPEGDPDGQFFHVAFPTTLNTSISDTEQHPPPTATFTYEKEEIEGFGDVQDFEQDFEPPPADTSGGDDFGTDSGGFESSPSTSGGSNGTFTPSTDSGTSGSFDGGDAPISAEDEPVDDPQTASDEAPIQDVPDDELGVQDALAAEAADDTGGMNLGYILLPLLGLGLATTLGYSLSQDPELPVEREGAVSKLMQRRQAQSAISSSSEA